MMEKIRINSIEMKGPNKTICVVKYDRAPENEAYGENLTRVNLEATLNTKWQSQEVNYLEKDVGLGGEVSVLIEQKGQYTNITKVDFKSAVKAKSVIRNIPSDESVRGFDKGAEKYIPSVAGERSKSIIAQCLVKAVIGQDVGELKFNIISAVEMYKEALELLG